MLWYRLGKGFICTPFPDRSLIEETVRPEVETQGAETASLIQLTARFGTVLEFLQACFSAGLAYSTLKVHVAALAAYHAPLGGLSVGKTL